MKWFAPDYHAATGLMGSEDKHLGNLNMCRSISGIDSYIGNVVARQWPDAFIDIGGTFVITMEAGDAEVRFHQSWLEVRDADGSMCHVNA